jgi:hypothetical protein
VLASLSLPLPLGADMDTVLFGATEALKEGSMLMAR